MSENILSGGLEYDAVWLRCTVVGSKKTNERIVRLDVPDTVEPPTFFMDPELVRVEGELPTDGETDGQVKVILLQRENGTLLIEVPGEPVSYGPKLRVPVTLALQ